MGRGYLVKKLPLGRKIRLLVKISNAVILCIIRSQN